MAPHHDIESQTARSPAFRPGRGAARAPTQSRAGGKVRPSRRGTLGWAASLPQRLEICGLRAQGCAANCRYCLEQALPSPVYVAECGSGVVLAYEDGAWSVKPSVESAHAFIFAEGAEANPCSIANSEWMVSDGSRWVPVPSTFRITTGSSRAAGSPARRQGKLQADGPSRSPVSRPMRQRRREPHRKQQRTSTAAAAKPSSRTKARGALLNGLRSGKVEQIVAEMEQDAVAATTPAQPLSTTRVARRPRTVSPPAGSGGQPHVHFSRFDPSRSRELDERRAAASNRRRLAVAEQLRASSVRRARQRLSGAQLEPAAAVVATAASAGGRHARSNAFADTGGPQRPTSRPSQQQQLRQPEWRHGPLRLNSVPGARIFNKQY